MIQLFEYAYFSLVSGEGEGGARLSQSIRLISLPVIFDIIWYMSKVFSERIERKDGSERLYISLKKTTAAAMAQWVKAFAPQAEGLVFEFQPRQTLVVKTGSDSSTAKRSVIDEYHGSLEMTIINGFPVSQ